MSAIVGLCAAAGAFMSCGGGDDDNEKEEEEIVSGHAAPAKPAEPLSVSVYLDNSSSMRGYYAPKTGSAAELANILAAIQTKYREAPLRAFYTQKGPRGTEVKEYDFNTLSTQLATKKLGYTDAYQLDQFIKAIDAQATADTLHRTLSFFITDGILSGSDAEIQANREFNRVNAPLLRNRIDQALIPLAKRGYGVALFQFPVDFNGTYFNYSNGQSQFSGKRPIYAIAIGPEYDIAELVKQADSNSLSGFTPAHSLQITKSGAQVVPSVSGSERSGHTFEAKPSEDDVTEKNGIRYARMRITFPTAALPTYLRDEEAVRQAVAVEMDGQPVDPSSIRVSNGRVVIPVEVKELTSPKFTLRVNDALPGWVMEANCDNDTNIAATSAQTFNLANLVEGLRQGVTGASTSLVFGPETYTIDWSAGEIDE
ncbi:MAG: hypothetical protein NC548_60260 [Lachnospiraceae bacterium]|nr:hypothetical protein [Lachnospiraceae bacterium]